MSSAGDAIKTSPTICPDGTVYAGSGNGTFVALTGTTGTADKQWPLSQRCSRHLDRFGGSWRRRAQAMRREDRGSLHEQAIDDSGQDLTILGRDTDHLARVPGHKLRHAGYQLGTHDEQQVAGVREQRQHRRKAFAALKLQGANLVDHDDGPLSILQGCGCRREHDRTRRTGNGSPQTRHGAAYPDA